VVGIWGNGVDEPAAGDDGKTLTYNDGNDDFDWTAVPSVGGLTLEYQFDTTTAKADPGAGKLRFNHGTPASVTELYIDDLAYGSGLDLGPVLDDLAVGDRIYIQQCDTQTKSALFSVSSVATDEAGYWSIVVTVDASGTLPDDGAACVLLVITKGGGGGATTFVGLTDTPAAYAGQAGKYTKVNAGATALEFGTPGGGGATTFVGLTDTPAAYAGQAGKYTKVNAGATALEFGTPGGGGSKAWPYDVPGAAWAQANLFFYNGTAYYYPFSPFACYGAADADGPTAGAWDNTRPGNRVYDTTPTANVFAGLYVYGGTNSSPRWGYRHYCCYVVNFPNSTDLSYWAGLASAFPNHATNAWPWATSTTQKLMCGFYWRGGTDTNWHGVCSDYSATPDDYTRLDLGIAPSAGWHVLEVEMFDDAGTRTAQFWIDGVSGGTITTKVPSQLAATKMYNQVALIPQVSTTPTTEFWISRLQWMSGEALTYRDS